MQSLDESLKELNAVIEEEIDEKKAEQPKYYLKIRLFPSQDLYSSTTDLETVSFTDEFYDVLPTFNNIMNEPNIVFHRKRINESTKVWKLVKQSAKTLNNRSHLYVEESLSNEEILNGMHMYLSFRFDRIYYIRTLNEEKQEIFSLYLDKICEPFDYSVLSCRILIQENIYELTSNKIQALVGRFCPETRLPETRLPVYTKFAYMLQCSKYCHLEERLYPTDLVYDRMKEEMLVRNYLEFQEYLWTFDRIVQFQSIFDVFNDYDETVRRVQKLESQFKKGLFTVNVAEDKDIEDYT